MRVATRLELPIEGMTLRGVRGARRAQPERLDGVTAAVNFATEQAAVEYDAAHVTPGALVAAVVAAGYWRACRTAAPAREPHGRAAAVRLARRRRAPRSRRCCSR